MAPVHVNFHARSRAEFAIAGDFVCVAPRRLIKSRVYVYVRRKWAGGPNYTWHNTLHGCVRWISARKHAFLISTGPISVANRRAPVITRRWGKIQFLLWEGEIGSASLRSWDIRSKHRKKWQTSGDWSKINLRGSFYSWWSLKGNSLSNKWDQIIFQWNSWLKCDIVS